MKISAIILNWNRPADTIKAAKSVLAQNYPDVHIVIWDNASSDSSKDILEKEFGDNSRIQMIFAAQNYGVAGGRNRAVRASDGDILFFLDSDAEIETPSALSSVAQRMAADPQIGALSFEIVRPDRFLMWPFARPASAWRHKEFDVARVDGCAFAVRRNAFEKAGAFAEHFSPYGAEDLHFSYKLIDGGYRILYFPSAVAIHAFSPKGRTGIQFTMHVRNMLLIILELFPLPHVFASIAKMTVSLGRDAWAQHQKKEYLNGVWNAVCEFNMRDRIPISRKRWAYIRDIVETEKRLQE